MADSPGEPVTANTTRAMTVFGAAPHGRHTLRAPGRFVLQERQEDPEAGYENLLRYQPWIHAEAIAVTTVEEAFPVIHRVTR